MLSQPSNDRDIPEVPHEVRESYISALSAIVPADELEQRDIADSLRWLHSAEHVNKPHNMDEHLGVFAVVLSQDGTHTFLLHHRKAGVWLPPGGHVDLAQTFEECVLAEVEEELGMTQSVLLNKNPVFHTRTLTQGINAGHIDVTTWYLVGGESGREYVVQAKEASHSGWVSVAELLQTPTLSHLHRGFRKIQQSKL